jgi:hypothetical protein
MLAVAESEAKAGEGSLSADANPSSGAARHLLPQGEKGKRALFSSYCTAIDVIRARDIRGMWKITVRSPSKATSGRIFDVA